MQKNACRIILGDKYKSYENAKKCLNLDSLKVRREKLCLRFALKTSKHPKMKKMFPKQEKEHIMKTRNPEKFKVHHAKTERMKKSPITEHFPCSNYLIRPNFGVILSLYGPIWPYLGPKWAIFVIGMRPEIIFRVYLYKCTTFLLKHFLCSNYFIWPNCGFILSLYGPIWPFLGPKWAILLLV